MGKTSARVLEVTVFLKMYRPGQANMFFFSVVNYGIVLRSFVNETAYVLKKLRYQRVS